MEERMLWYRLMNQRDALDKDGRFAYQLLVNGDRGESDLVRTLLEQGFEDIWWRRNLWLARQVECDVILVTYEKIYILNAKYYNGDFLYRDTVAYFNGTPLQNDPVNSFQASLGRLKKLLKEAGIEVPIEGRLVFMNPDYSVTFDDTVSIECVPRYRVLKMFAEIDSKARQIGPRQGIQPEVVGAKLLAMESDSKYNLPVVTDSQLQQMSVGFMCPECKNGRGVTVSMHMVSCRCGFYALSKRESVLNAIEEYCKLFHHREFFTSLDIYNFLGGQVRRRYLARILTSKCNILGKGPNYSYLNPFFRNPKHYANF